MGHTLIDEGCLGVLFIGSSLIVERDTAHEVRRNGSKMSHTQLFGKRLMAKCSGRADAGEADIVSSSALMGSRTLSSNRS